MTDYQRHSGDLHPAGRIHADPSDLRPGTRVRLRPHRSADVLDMVFVGLTGTIATVEEDLEGRIHLAVTLDDDPGKDLGPLCQPAHRFFFDPSEVETLEGDGSPS